MDLSDVLTHAANLAELASVDLRNLTADPDATRALSAAGHCEPILQATRLLPGIVRQLRRAASALAAEAAIAEPAPPDPHTIDHVGAPTAAAHCGHCGAAVVDAAAHKCIGPRPEAIEP